VRELLKSQDAHWSLVSGFFAAPLALGAQVDDVLDPRQGGTHSCGLPRPSPWMWPQPNMISTSPARSEGRVGTKCTTMKSASPPTRSAMRRLSPDFPAGYQRVLPRHLRRCHNLRHIRPVYFPKWAEGMHAARGTDGE
jgi:hypothetical protein